MLQGDSGSLLWLQGGSQGPWGPPAVDADSFWFPIQAFGGDAGILKLLGSMLAPANRGARKRHQVLYLMLDILFCFFLFDAWAKALGYDLLQFEGS